MKFHEPEQQKMYDKLVGLSDDDAENIGKGGYVQSAFTWGFEGGKQVGIHKYPKKSHAYAAYCAGRDKLKFKRIYNV